MPGVQHCFLHGVCELCGELQTVDIQPECPVNGYQLNSSATVAVATDYYWEPINAYTPRGVKLQLLGRGGIAIYAIYVGDKFFTHWAPLPKKRNEE